MRPGLAALLSAILLVSGTQVRASDFDRSFAAVVTRNCLSCHNASEHKGGLDLTRRQSVLQGGDSGAALVPGKPDDSFLIERVAEGSMPPAKKGRRLSAEEVGRLRDWVRSGATWPAGRVLSPFDLTTDRRAGYDWWSLQPVARPAVPNVRARDWVRQPIDAFILKELEWRGLMPAPEADRVSYLRRLKFDLLGLPPTPTEIDAFLADRSADAYERLVDRLLASPHYGERWGRHWLDVARFGESDGFERDQARDHAWRYRDYVIRAFNKDRPYAQFIKEQLAGDVLTPVTRDGIVASGFLVAGPWDEIQNVAQSRLERMRTHEEQIEEQIGTVTQTFLGMTVNCARCHDHKFDPIPQSDYYRLKAVFDGVDFGNTPLPPAGGSKGELSYSGVRRQAGLTFVLQRGDIRKPGRQVTAGGLSAVRVLSPEFGLVADAPEGQRRLRFAEWVASPDNPLTARVLVNRVWQYHFGHGFIATPSDFGFNGGRPSHPELLDWLARRFLDDGGSIKRLHRQIVLSATYRQSSRLDPKAAAADSDNRLLWRFTPRRLEGEVVRDAMLAVSGELNPRLGGPSFRPFTVTVFNSTFYHLFDSGAPEFNRRTLYRMCVNTAKDPLLDTLDCPAPSITMPRRRTTTTPLQALALMNDTFVLRQADRFAARVRRAAGDGPNAQVRLAYRLAFGRPPREDERADMVALVKRHGLPSACWVLLNASEFLYAP